MTRAPGRLFRVPRSAFHEAPAERPRSCTRCRHQRGTRNSELGTLFLLLCLATPAAAQVPAGDSAWARGDYPAARAHYESALHDDAGSVRALYRLGILAAWDGRLDSALALLRDAREMEPGEPDVRLQEATVLSWKGRYAESLIKWDSLIVAHPERRDAAYGRARTLAWAGRLTEADRAYADLFRSDTTDLDALAGQAQVAAWRGDLGQASQYYLRVLARNPGHVGALVGLGQVRQWQGRPGEAEQYVARALAVAPADRTALEAQRAIRALRRPRADLTLGWSRDSDRNTLWWQNAATSLLLANGLRGFASAGVAEASDPVRNGSRLSGEAGLSLDRGHVNLTGALGVRRLSSDGAADRSPATWRVASSLRLSPAAGLGAGYAHYSFDETALLLGRGLDVDELSLDADVEPRPGLSLGAGAGTAWLSDDNRRRWLLLAVTQRVAGHFTVGAFGRVLGYDTRGDGYFAPDRFLVGEVRGSYTYGVRRWAFRLSGGLGTQKIGKAGSAQSEWHGEARAARRWSIDNEVALSGGISNSAESSTTGAFRYYTAALTLRLGL
ncbi:MAG TPA: tetratricopeptide repeat protein [Gemmatimonadales bacterium]|nr:tetratricopeptide repeat protein [Gemmatimonadales bacterium]